MRKLVLGVVVFALCMTVCGWETPASARSGHKNKASHTRKAGSEAPAKTDTPEQKAKAPETAEPVAKADKTVPKEEPTAAPQGQDPTATKSTAPDEPCTSLIVDATGLKLDKAMSPKIFRKCGTEVWGTLKDLKDEDYNLLQEIGMVAYATTVDEAKSNPRAGARPLVVKAVSTQGTKFRSDLVVADEDGDLILAKNTEGKFLNKFSVILVRNETPPPPPPSETPTTDQAQPSGTDAPTADQTEPAGSDGPTADEVESPSSDGPTTDEVEPPSSDSSTTDEVEPPSSDGPTADEVEPPSSDSPTMDEVEPPSSDSSTMDEVEPPSSDSSVTDDVEPSYSDIPTTESSEI